MGFLRKKRYSLSLLSISFRMFLVIHGDVFFLILTVLNGAWSSKTVVNNLLKASTLSSVSSNMSRMDQGIYERSSTKLAWLKCLN